MGPRSLVTRQVSYSVQTLHHKQYVWPKFGRGCLLNDFSYRTDPERLVSSLQMATSTFNINKH